MENAEICLVFEVCYFTLSRLIFHMCVKLVLHGSISHCITVPCVFFLYVNNLVGNVENFLTISRELVDGSCY